MKLINKILGIFLGITDDLGGGRLYGAVLHHSGGTNSNPRASTKHHKAEDIDRWHKARWYGESKSKLGMYGGYTYFIDSEGKVTQFRGVYEEGYHTRGYNFNYVGICLAGNGDVESFSPLTISAFKTLWKELCTDHPELKGTLEPHRKYAWKSCPGSRFPDSWVHALEKETPTSTVEKQVEMVKLLQVLVNLLRQQAELLYKKTS